jgi:ketosteroid isomerase-like protein
MVQGFPIAFAAVSRPQITWLISCQADFQSKGVSLTMSNDSAEASGSHIETEQLLREMNDEWVKALVRRDVETLDRIMAGDFIFAYPMEGDDKAQFIADVAEGNIRVEFLNRENVSVRIWGDTAVLTAKDSAKWYYQGRDFSGHYKIIHVYARRDGEWHLVSVQACPMA